MNSVDYLNLVTYASTKGDSMDVKVSHLQMVQGVISRMAGNSFMIKGWSVTLISALFALAADKANPLFIYIAYFPGVTFWVLDAYFLRQERLFRKPYDHVRSLPEDSVDFSMNTSSFESGVAPQPTIIFSKTLFLFHGTIIFVILIIMLVLVFNR